MPVKIKVEVHLSPHERCLRAAQRHASWPVIAKLPVHVTRTGGGLAVEVSLGETNSKGVTKLCELDRGTYKVEIPGYDFETDIELDLTKVADGQTVPVRLAPKAGRCLLVLQFTEYPAGTRLAGASVRITSAGGGFSAPFTSASDGLVFATAPAGPVTFDFAPVPAAGGNIIPSDATVPYTVEETDIVQVIPVAYWPAIEILVEPTVTTPGGSEVLTDASATVEYRGSPGVPRFWSAKSLPLGQSSVSFEYTSPGVYVVTVTPPADFRGLPIKAAPNVTTAALPSGGSLRVPAQFAVVATQSVTFRVQTPQNLPLKGGLLQLQVLGSGSAVQPVTGRGTTFTADIPVDESLRVTLDPTATPVVTLPGVGDVPLMMTAEAQPLVAPPGENAIELDYLHSIKANIVDEHGSAVPGAMIDVLDGAQNPVSTVIADENGVFILGLKDGGTYYLAQHPQGGQVGRQERVEVHSRNDAVVRVHTNGQTAPSIPNGGGRGVTDLSAYPVLTEEITSTGGPVPAGGGVGGGTGAGYGQTVDQVIRDVLGWRPGGDVAGFQAALSGAFQLREVEGHTEWSWQQRGYAVQADMGALTGAQASIYARAKSALDQVLPLLASLTPLNPALYPPQDLEAIRTVITAELSELLGELGLTGGPRIQRVDELFGLLLGDKVGSKNLNPDVVHGHLGTLRDRFGLTLDEVDTVDEERIVTNFRIVVEQVLALQASWSTDRGLLTPLDPKASFGTVLIWLSRSLEAVVDSVNDLTFALDSVFVDAAQRQVIKLKLPGEPVLQLSDLLDWVVRASRDEGPRIIQDAGKDGVFAFAPVLRRLHGLVEATRHAARNGYELPDGMRTSRVDRALQVVVAQLSEAANLAGNVRRDSSPTVFSAQSIQDKQGQLVVDLTGTNFRRAAAAFVFAQNREEIPDLRARSVKVTSPTVAVATFRMPSPRGLTWMLVFTNEDGTSSPPVAITIPPAA